jgi:hypothetical protein
VGKSSPRRRPNPANTKPFLETTPKTKQETRAHCSRHADGKLHARREPRVAPKSKIFEKKVAIPAPKGRFPKLD